MTRGMRYVYQGIYGVILDSIALASAWQMTCG
jgi:hypothetical protein